MTVNRMPTKRTPGPVVVGKGIGSRPEQNVRAVGGPRRRLNEASEAPLDLVPGVRDRVQARLSAMGIPAGKSVSYVAGITQRAAQSVRRWLGGEEPGLPDLESFARLCVGLGSSADELIGLRGPSASGPAECADLIAVANCIRDLSSSLTRGGRLGVPMRVPGDEMAPHLNAGDLVFVDTTVTRLEGNGIYALSCDDSLLIRRLQQRVDKRIVLTCDNKAYRDCEWPCAATAARRRVRILGKVHGAISVQVF